MWRIPFLNRIDVFCQFISCKFKVLLNGHKISMNLHKKIKKQKVWVNASGLTPILPIRILVPLWIISPSTKARLIKRLLGDRLCSPIVIHISSLHLSLIHITSRFPFASSSSSSHGWWLVPIRWRCGWSSPPRCTPSSPYGTSWSSCYPASSSRTTTRWWGPPSATSHWLRQTIHLLFNIKILPQNCLVYMVITTKQYQIQFILLFFICKFLAILSFWLFSYQITHCVSFLY